MSLCAGMAHAHSPGAMLRAAYVVSIIAAVASAITTILILRAKRRDRNNIEKSIYSVFLLVTFFFVAAWLLYVLAYRYLDG